MIGLTRIVDIEGRTRWQPTIKTIHTQRLVIIKDEVYWSARIKNSVKRKLELFNTALRVLKIQTLDAAIEFGKLCGIDIKDINVVTVEE